jgi:hypothetical protein
MTRDRYGSGEHGDSFLATAVVGVIGTAALAVSIYAVVWARGQRDDVLTPQEQAYAAAKLSSTGFHLRQMWELVMPTDLAAAAWLLQP